MFAALLAVSLATSPVGVVEDPAPKNFLVPGFALGSLGTTAAVVAGAFLGMGSACVSDACYYRPTGTLIGIIVGGLALALFVGFPAVFEGFREIIRSPPST